MDAAVIAHFLAGLAAVHSVAWSLRANPNGKGGGVVVRSTAPFIPVSLAPLVAAPVWDPIDTWAVFATAGILLAVAVAPVRFWYGPLRSETASSVLSTAWPVATGLVLMFGVNALSIAANDGSWITHSVCALAAAALCIVGVLFA
jgi:hypothetical protein